MSCGARYQVDYLVPGNTIKIYDMIVVTSTYNGMTQPIATSNFHCCNRTGNVLALLVAKKLLWYLYIPYHHQILNENGGGESSETESGIINKNVATTESGYCPCHLDDASSIGS